MMFECDACGACCRNLNKSVLYDELDEGNGKCRYLMNNKCSIYDERPLLCRVDECYEVYFKSSMTKREYYRLNMLVCKELKKSEEE